MITKSSPTPQRDPETTATMVWVLIIDHRHGTNISVHSTHAQAIDSLYDYCIQEWDDGLDEQYGKLENLSRYDAIESYFDAWGQCLDPEWYLLEERPLEPL